MTDDTEDRYDFDARKWHRISEDCFSKRPLYPNESRFTEDMVARTLRGQHPSPAQARWLMKIHHRRYDADA